MTYLRKFEKSDNLCIRTTLWDGTLVIQMVHGHGHKLGVLVLDGRTLSVGISGSNF